MHKEANRLDKGDREIEIGTKTGTSGEKEEDQRKGRRERMKKRKGGYSGSSPTEKPDTRTVLLPGRRCLLISQSLDFLQSSILSEPVVLTRK